jgi:hypothetical protein
LQYEKKFEFLSCSHQGTEFEFTEVQKLNQGTNPIPIVIGRAVIPARPVRRGFRGSFFVTFLEKQKSKNKKSYYFY